jgi:hypothetical protein
MLAEVAVGRIEGALWYVAGGLAASIVAFGTAYAVYAVRELRAHGPAIAIGPAGLHDRRISELPIPWEAVRRVDSIRYGAMGTKVMFEIDAGQEPQFGVRLGPRIKSRINRALGLAGYDLIQMGNEASTKTLVAAISPFKTVEHA